VSFWRGDANIQLIYVNIGDSSADTLRAAAPETASVHLLRWQKRETRTMHPKKHFSIKSATVGGIAASALLGLAGLTLSPGPANAVVYCQYTAYPAGCVARPGVVLGARPVARAAVRHNAGGNANGGVNRVGVRR
jgi:hypothetical protein